MKKRMTNRQRFIAGCIDPYYRNFATKKEVKLAKNLAKGRFWNDHDFSQYCSYSPTGIRMFFEYCYDRVTKSVAKNASRYWSKGNYKLAKLVYDGENRLTPKFRVLYIKECYGEYTKTVAEIHPYGDYSVIGNGGSFHLKDFKKDWKNTAKWGRYIKIP